jgi:hypothetical protein
LISSSFDIEFKRYMHTRGVNIDATLFDLKFNEPLNFASSRQAALDTERINTFNTIQQVPYMSHRFALKRFLGLTEDEIAENERLWAEEQGEGSPNATDSAGELRSAGLSAGGIAGDVEGAGDLSAPEGMENPLAPPPGMEATGAMPGAPGTPPPA